MSAVNLTRPGAGTANRLRPLVRPNGKPYRPRTITAELTADDIGGPGGVMVLGTHDLAAAQVLADAEADRYDHGYVAAGPAAGWYRIVPCHGDLTWIDDPVRGRAGVWFQRIEEP